MLEETHQLFKLSPQGGNILIILYIFAKTNNHIREDCIRNVVGQ